MEKTVPLITCDVALCQYFCELVFGVNVFDLDLEVQIDSIKQSIKRDSVGTGHMFQCWTSALDDHLDHRFIIFKSVEHRTKLRRLQV